MMNPEIYSDLIENADIYQSALRIKTYFDSYANQPRYMEDKQKMEHRIRDMINGKIKLPKSARDDIQLIQKRVQQQADEQHLSSIKEQKQAIEK